MRKTKRAFIFAGIVFVIILMAGYWNINRKMPPAIVEEAKIGEQLELMDGVMVSVDSYRFLSDEEQKQLIEKVAIDPWVEYKSLEVHLTIENTSTERKKIVISDLNVEGTGMSNGLPKECIDASQGKYSSIAQDLQPKQKKQICFPYNIIKNEIAEKEWDHIEERKIWLTFSSYPIKTKLLLNQEGKTYE